MGKKNEEKKVHIMAIGTSDSGIQKRRLQHSAIQFSADYDVKRIVKTSGTAKFFSHTKKTSTN